MSSRRSGHTDAGDRGILFDMDGVLVASEDLKARAHVETVRRYGGALDPGDYAAVMGRSHEAAAIAFIEASGTDLDPATYAEVFRSVYGGLLGAGVALMPGVEPLLAEVERRGYRLAVVSSSLRWMMDAVLASTGLNGVFATSISADDVSAQKPSPEPYLTALARLSLAPGQAVIIEDSETGVEAGVRAGVPVIAVRHRYNARHDFSGSFAVLTGLADTGHTLQLIDSAFQTVD